jgi:hypothetical protein
VEDLYRDIFKLCGAQNRVHPPPTTSGGRDPEKKNRQSDTDALRKVPIKRFCRFKTYEKIVIFANFWHLPYPVEAVKKLCCSKTLLFEAMKCLCLLKTLPLRR